MSSCRFETIALAAGWRGVRAAGGCDSGATCHGFGLGLLSLVCLASILVETSSGWGAQTKCMLKT